MKSYKEKYGIYRFFSGREIDRYGGNDILTNLFKISILVRIAVTALEVYNKEFSLSGLTTYIGVAFLMWVVYEFSMENEKYSLPFLLVNTAVSVSLAVMLFDSTISYNMVGDDSLTIFLALMVYAVFAIAKRLNGFYYLVISTKWSDKVY